MSRAQNGAGGIIVDYTGGDIAAAFQPGSPYSRADACPSDPASVRYVDEKIGETLRLWRAEKILRAA